MVFTLNLYLNVDYADSGEEISFDLEGDDSVPVLRAVLTNIDGEGVPADLNLAEAIGNDDGVLVFGMFSRLSYKTN